MAKWDLSKLDKESGGDIKAKLERIIEQIDALQAKLDKLEQEIPEMYK